MSDPAQQKYADSALVYQSEWGFAPDEGVRVFPADSHWYLFIQRHNGKTKVGVTGPRTQVCYVPHAAEVECFGIYFKTGAFLPHLATLPLVNSVVFLPEATSKSFWFNGSAWEIPTPDNFETFVNRLAREELLICDPVINSVLLDQPQDMSFSTVRRRFLRATGLKPGTIRQIERARYAVELLRRGISILDTVHEAGYFDQPHLTRSLKRFMGQTPAQLARLSQSELG